MLLWLETPAFADDRPSYPEIPLVILKLSKFVQYIVFRNGHPLVAVCS